MVRVSEEQGASIMPRHPLSKQAWDGIPLLDAVKAVERANATQVNIVEGFSRLIKAFSLELDANGRAEAVR